MSKPFLHPLSFVCSSEMRPVNVLGLTEGCLGDICSGVLSETEKPDFCTMSQIVAVDRFFFFSRHFGFEVGTDATCRLPHSAPVVIKSHQELLKSFFHRHITEEACQRPGGSKCRGTFAEKSTDQDETQKDCKWGHEEGAKESQRETKCLQRDTKQLERDSNQPRRCKTAAKKLMETTQRLAAKTEKGKHILKKTQNYNPKKGKNYHRQK